MSIRSTGLSQGLGSVPLLPRHSNESDEAVPNAARPSVAPAALSAPPTHRGVLPAEAPAGTDPALWEVLTPEERMFFARSRAMGPLTYGRGVQRDASVPGALQGGRIDVRV